MSWPPIFDVNRSAIIIVTSRFLEPVGVISAMNTEYHRSNGHISIDRHVKSRVVELGRLLDARAAIYLDTNFWILLRKSALGLDSNNANSELLRQLHSGVTKEKLFCPASDSVFLELLKQSDSSSRVATARLIDGGMLVSGPKS